MADFHEFDAFYRPSMAQIRAQAEAGQLSLGEGEERYGFADMLDLVNPLQHIPLVSNLYRALTGDEIKAPVQVVGKLIYGGPIGVMGGAVMAAVSQAMDGNPVDEVMVAAVDQVRGDDPYVALAKADEPDQAPEGEAAATLAADGAKAPGTAAIVPASASTATGPLEGRAALDAFLLDLAAAQAQAPESRPPEPPAESTPAKSFDVQFIENLHKYEALRALQRNREGATL